jgi:hypothetical protein
MMVSDDFGSISKESAIASFKVLSQYLLAGTEKTRKKSQAG